MKKAPAFPSWKISHIIGENAIAISKLWAAWYQRDGKGFIQYLRTSSGGKLIADCIIGAYKYNGGPTHQPYAYAGAWQEVQACGKDFSDYAEKVTDNERDRRRMADILLIIYALNH